MKQHHVFSFLQRMGKSFMLPIAVLPVAGIFLGVGSSLTNETTIAALHLESVLGQGTFLYSVLILLKQVGKVLFDNLPLIFAVSIALGMSKRRKEVAALAAIIAFFVMHATINTLLCLDGSIVNGVVSNYILDGSITSVCGMLSLEMGVFGGIVVGLGVSYLHNHFYQIQLPNVISFYEGERFVPIICAITYVFIGVLMYFIWPPLQQGVYNLGQFISDSGYFGTFIYGIIKRSLVPFGLHHVWYMPFYQSALGGVQMVNGSIISGAQNIFFAQLSDPSVTHFSVDATKFLSGEFIFMIFGLPGAALAMYQCANPEAKKKTASLLLSAALTSALTGITEPIEFSFLFVAPLLYVVHVLLAATCFVVAQALQVAIGFTFSAGLLDFTLFGILQGNAKTNWMIVVLLGTGATVFYNMISNMLRALGDSKTPLYFLVFSSVLNIFMDLWMVAGLGLGVFGAALATLIAQGISAVFSFLIFLYRMRRYKCQFEWFDGQELYSMLQIAIPSVLQQSTVSIGMMIVQAVVNPFGTQALAGYSATMRVENVFSLIFVSIGNAISPYISQNLGAKKYQRIRKGVHSGTYMALLTSVVISGVMVLFGRNIVSLFVSGEPEQIRQVLDIAYKYLFIMAIFLWVLYLLYVYRSAIQGLGNTLIPLASGIAEFVMRVSVALLLPKLIGEDGIFYAEICAWTSVAVPPFISYMIIIRKYKEYNC